MRRLPPGTSFDVIREVEHLRYQLVRADALLHAANDLLERVGGRQRREHVAHLVDLAKQVTATARAMAADLSAATRQTCDVSSLVLSVKCGGSDGFSGLSANPALGRAADLLVRSGGTLWRRYYVSPDGKRVLRPVAAAQPQATPPRAATAAAR